MIEQLTLQRLLRDEYTRMKLKNPAYSRGAFAKKLGLSAAALSEILAGKRRVSWKIADRVSRKLSLDPTTHSNLIGVFQQARLREFVFGDQGKVAARTNLLQLETDQFALISDWQHFAILSLLETKGAQLDVVKSTSWIAKRLSLTATAVEQAVERLIRLGLIEVKCNKLLLTGKSCNTPDHVANSALRKLHAQNLDLARNSLEQDSIDERDFTAITMAIDTDLIPTAKQMIREFRDRLCQLMESGQKKQVYKFCAQLLPLTHQENEQSHDEITRRKL